MIVFPAIDIKNGKCVRLLQGEKDKETVYFENPVEVALMWQEKGAQFLHIVDLDGAFDGVPKNLELIASLVKSVDIPVQIGGGIRNEEIIRQYLDTGINRVIIGTKAVTDPDFTKNMLEKYDKKIVISIDAKDNMVCTKGWVETSDISVDNLCDRLIPQGLKTIVYTDISKDGMMAGPNFGELRRLNDKYDISIIASGGISKAADLDQVRDMDIYGVITGKALYEGAIQLDNYLNKEDK
jgi:phosphoribosylformimino-5-aminoimidazole carboxamide ribotide isomerase